MAKKKTNKVIEIVVEIRLTFELSGRDPNDTQENAHEQALEGLAERFIESADLLPGIFRNSDASVEVVDKTYVEEDAIW